MKALNIIVIVILVASVALGGGLGLFLQSAQPPGQIYEIQAFAVQTSSPVRCGTIPKNSSEWLGIQVIGNRTSMNFATVTVYDPGNRISATLPLNGTANVDFVAVNSTLETIVVPLASDYFDSGDTLSLSIVYSISTFNSQVQSLTDIPIIQRNVAC